MARAKKEADLTPEERLQAALVPDWDWPYKLPENWCWTKIGSISSLHRGVSYKKTDAHTERRENSCLVMRGGNICEGSIDTEADNIYVDISLVAENQIVRKNDIIIVASTGSTKVIGRAGISKMDYLDVAFGAFLLLVRPSTKVNQRYIDYFFLSDNYRNRIKKLASGININNIRGEYITETLVPLAPLAEQQRIVDRIESLFAKLDEAKEKAQAVVDSFETRKAAILHKAFTGELTKKWRKSANTRWVYKKIKDCCKLGSGGTPSRKVPDFYKGDIPWIKTGEIEWNDIYDTEEKITQSAIDNSSARCYKPGVVLVAMYGMGVTRGKASILRVQAATNQAVCVLEPQSALLYNRYLLYYFMRNYWDIREKAVGGNQLNLSLTIIKELNIEIPPIDEQMEIVQILDDLFAKEQQAKESAEAVLDQIDLMKKSILARAFRGELGTNDPSEESAMELLKRVL
jgi:type I restriction enzyme S subunit